MSLYVAYRDWTDSIMRESAIRAPAPVLFPALLPALAVGLFGIRSTVPVVLVCVWAGIVIAWGAWRYARILKDEAGGADEEYMHKGRFRLSKEYHSAEPDELPNGKRR